MKAKRAEKGAKAEIERPYEPATLQLVLDRVDPHGLKGWFGQVMLKRTLRRMESQKGINDFEPRVITGLPAEALVDGLERAVTEVPAREPSHMAAISVLSASGLMVATGKDQQPRLQPVTSAA